MIRHLTPFVAFVYFSCGMNNLKSRARGSSRSSGRVNVLYPLVLVEAARRPFNRTQLESLSEPIEEIDTPLFLRETTVLERRTNARLIR